jgi:hypothetical protein
MEIYKEIEADAAAGGRESRQYLQWFGTAADSDEGRAELLRHMFECDHEMHLTLLLGPRLLTRAIAGAVLADIYDNISRASTELGDLVSVSEVQSVGELVQVAVTFSGTVEARAVVQIPVDMPMATYKNFIEQMYGAYALLQVPIEALDVGYGALDIDLTCTPVELPRIGDWPVLAVQLSPRIGTDPSLVEGRERRGAVFHRTVDIHLFDHSTRTSVSLEAHSNSTMGAVRDRMLAGLHPAVRPLSILVIGSGRLGPLVPSRGTVRDVLDIGDNMRPLVLTSAHYALLGAGKRKHDLDDSEGGSSDFGNRQEAETDELHVQMSATLEAEYHAAMSVGSLTAPMPVEEERSSASTPAPGPGPEGGREAYAALGLEHHFDYAVQIGLIEANPTTTTAPPAGAATASPVPLVEHDPGESIEAVRSATASAATASPVPPMEHDPDESLDATSGAVIEEALGSPVAVGAASSSSTSAAPGIGPTAQVWGGAWGGTVLKDWVTGPS